MSSSSSPVHEIPYPLACDDRTRDAVQTIVSGRKSWKTLKGKGEAVWPPYLEAALVEALDKYRPETSRSTRSLSRFPNRNRFISDYIYHVTGKRRTAKQVGSRLQQLRDTHGGKRILKLLSSRDYSDDADQPSLVSQPPHGFKPSRALVKIDVLPADAPFPSLPSSSSSSSAHAGYPRSASAILTPPLSPTSPLSALPSLATPLAPLPAPSSSSSSMHPGTQAAVTTFHSPFPRPLRVIDPTVTFTSAALVQASSACTVYFNGNPVHRESTRMDVNPAHDSHGYVYRVGLIPSFWPKLCESNDPGRYSIVQEITQSNVSAPTTPLLASPIATPSTSVLLTVVYQLQEPSSGHGSMEGSPAASPSLSPTPAPAAATAADYGNYTLCDPAYLQPDLPISPVSATFSDGPHPTAYAPSVQVPASAAPVGSPFAAVSVVPPPPPPHHHHHHHHPHPPAMTAPQASYDFDPMASWYGMASGMV